MNELDFDMDLDPGSIHFSNIERGRFQITQKVVDKCS